MFSYSDDFNPVSDRIFKNAIILRRCKIYDSRPGFCVVDVTRYKKMYQIEAGEMNDFCTFCCQEQIAGLNKSILNNGIFYSIFYRHIVLLLN